MENFSKSILNYFATYNETRFRFNKKIPYLWTNNEFTLDLSVFENFQSELLEKIQKGENFSLHVKPGEFQIKIEVEKFKNLLIKKIDSNYNSEYLASCIQKAEELYGNEKKISVDEEGNATEDDDVNDELVQREAFRNYNIAFRNCVSEVLREVQEQRRKELDIENAPPSSLNPSQIEQEIYDDLKNIAQGCDSPGDYISKIKEYIRKEEFKLVMYDLYLMINSYLHFLSNKSLYLFFHEIKGEEASYPIYFLELNIKNLNNGIEFSNARDIVMINTPAINSFKFGNILTIPRACKLEQANSYLDPLELFVQAYYKNENKILGQFNFDKLVAQDLPTIKARIGLQILDDDRKILDYSELMTKLDEGAGNKFVNMVTDYVDENVESTIDEVHTSYKKTYPRKSVKNLVSDIPVKLNDSQKRVLLAAKNPKNKIIKVEGPPGTGKSYTITALVYLANLMGKSVLISSHKKQALNVVEEKLEDQFKRLHPNAKPSLLRLTKKTNMGETANNVETTLSSTAIAAAAERALEFNGEAVEKDREELYKELENENEKFWEQSEAYEEYLKHSGKFLDLQRKISEHEFNLLKLPKELTFPSSPEYRSKYSIFNKVGDINWENFIKLFEIKNKFPSLIESCDELNKSKGQPIPEETVKDLTLENVKELKEIVDILLKCCHQDIQLSDLVFGELNEIHDIKTQYSKDYSGLLVLREILSNIAEIDKNFTSKVFKSKERKREINKLELDFPKAYKEIQKQDAKIVLKQIDATIKKVKDIKKEHEFLTEDYILVKHKGLPVDSLSQNVEQLKSLEFTKLFDSITNITEKEKSELTLKDISKTIALIEDSIRYYELEEEINELKDLLNQEDLNLGDIYSTLINLEKVFEEIDEEFVESVENLFRYYSDFLLQLNIGKENLKSLTKLSEEREEIEDFWKLTKEHEYVSHYEMPEKPSKDKITKIEEKIQKLIEHENDQRMKNLSNYSVDVQKALTAFNTGKRLNREQADALINNLSCIISDPQLVSEYLPMEEDMFDMLIIDEASQVSIAESISLMLRAKQTIVFGDELQYGAVSAQNVSQKYSKSYFKDILNEYENDKNEEISEDLKEKLASDVSKDIKEEEQVSSPVYTVDPNTKEWLKTFGIRTSTLAFAEALANYKTSLDVHFRSFPEIISYSKNEFYKKVQINLITNRIRTKPINQVLRFIEVDTQGFAGKNINLDEIEAIRIDIEDIMLKGFKGTIGIITSFREQAMRMEAIFREDLTNYHDIKRNNKLKIWFVGDVQGVERDIVYYSLVQDKKTDNGDLKYIYPVVDGSADNIHNLQKQRLNVGFSRAKDTMVFVHSMPLKEYSDTSLGEALEHYRLLAEKTQDNYIEDENQFESPAERKLYSLITQTEFYDKNRDNIRILPQFNIGKYLNEKYHEYIPKYRVDFLLTYFNKGKETALIIEYDGLEYHFKNPDDVNQYNFDQEYIEYDVQRQLELEQYGYSFLRINKFNLMPKEESQTEVDVINELLLQKLN